MSHITDQTYLRNHQYQDASRFQARVTLHARFGTNPYGWHRGVFDQFRLPETGRVLELGCGPRWLWRENRDRIPDGWAIVLSDFSAGMLDETRRNLTGLGRPFTFEVADAQAIPFAEAIFDGVVANHMLYHVPDKTQALREIRRVLKPGGTFYAATNGGRHTQEISELARRCEIPGFGNAPGSPWHSGFGLENGGEMLAAWFADVTPHRHENSLRITDPEPLIAYMRSVMSQPERVADQLEQVRALVAQEIAQRGAFHVTLETGLFLAS